MFFNILSLAGPRALCDSLGEQSHKLAIANFSYQNAYPNLPAMGGRRGESLSILVLGKSGVCAQLLLGDYLVGRAALVSEDLEGRDLSVQGAV